MAANNAKNWSACKSVLKDWPAGELLKLVQTLYALSPENQQFLDARLMPTTEASVRRVVARLSKLLSVSAIYGDRFSHADAKRIVDQFAKATKNPAAVADVLVADLVQSYCTYNDVADFKPMVDHIYATLARLDQLLPQIPKKHLQILVERTSALANTWHNAFGYGLSDELDAYAADWEQLANIPRAT